MSCSFESMHAGTRWLHEPVLDTVVGGPVGGATLAEAHGLPGPYLVKQLQQPTRAGPLASVPGPRGGFRLARPISEITLLDVVEAIEGDALLFHCSEIRCGGRIGELAPPRGAVPGQVGDAPGGRGPARGAGGPDARGRQGGHRP